MSRKRSRRNRQVLLRTTGPGGTLMYVPAGVQQSTYGTTFYGTKTANVPVGQTALFSPGQPLPPQQGVNPGGLPIRWRFPVAYNTFPPDRSQGAPDIPPFQQLRNLARLCDAVALCERVWFDLVPRMTLKIGLKPQYLAQGAEEKQYQKQITFFLKWFESPDKMNDLHSWLRMALREQTQIDELYLYRRKKRGGMLHSLEIIAGDQMKPLIDEWGMIPQPPKPAYQQYPWGIPGWEFTTDEMIHYQESPAADSLYGQSRVERVLLRVNQLLRKQRKDLEHFTSGNIPQGIMTVPESANWTPDQIDAFEQSWNALLAGNAQQQVRVRFTQPGMAYQPLEQYALDPAFDTFLLNISTAAYGISMNDLGFTEQIHKSSGDSQQNSTYRRTIDPLATIYANILTDCINNDFPDTVDGIGALQGDLFQASFGGYDEEEDLQAMVAAYAQATGAGLIGITDATKALKMPEPKDAPYIGRVLLTKDGPIFLDDMAQDKLRNAAIQAKLAGFQLATNPPQQETADNETAQQDGTAQDASPDAHPPTAQPSQAQSGAHTAGKGAQPSNQERSTGAVSDGQTDSSAEYRRWRQRATDDVKAGKAQRGFTTTLIPAGIHRYISEELTRCVSVEDVRAVFARAKDLPADFGEWQALDPDIQRNLEKLRAKGITHIRWQAHPGCEHCYPNDNQIRAIGQPFPSGGFIPPLHPGCGCTYVEMRGLST